MFCVVKESLIIQRSGTGNDTLERNNQYVVVLERTSSSLSVTVFVSCKISSMMPVLSEVAAAEFRGDGK